VRDSGSPADSAHARRPIPTFVTTGSGMREVSDNAALEQILATEAGRAALKRALGDLREDDRKERLLRSAASERAQYEMRWQHIATEVGMTAEESND
jgi:hypothetical protein